MTVDDLNDDAVSRYMEAIAERLNTFGSEDKRHFLSVIVDELEILDQDDCFGTEGWLHEFGLDD